MSKNVELVLDIKAQLGEGPIWHAQAQLLYWVNIMGHELHIYNPATHQDRVINVGQYVGAVVPRQAGGVMLALHHGFASLDLETEQLTLINDPEADLPGNRFNDGKCDPVGRFWAGTMGMEGDTTGKGSLYCMDTDLSVRKMVDNVTTSNGIVWSLDHKTMYYIDTRTKRVDAFDYDLASGDISNRRPAITFPEGVGSPDGSTLDAEGMLWVAHWGGARITRWNPTKGELLQTIEVPALQVTACAFGGPNLDQLYITTARHNLDEATLAKYPHAGGLFVVEPGAQGIEAYEFKG
jgi:sugar lactone lactonase YvrE